MPEKATLLGPCSVIPQEYPYITCRNIDIVIPTTDGWQNETLIAQVASDLLSESQDTAIAYRANQRWVQAFEPVQLQQVPGTNTRLREEGVYLITGGLGGIGLELAAHLARTKRAKLALVGRTPLPVKDEWQSWVSTHAVDDEVSNRIRRVLEIEELGGEVLVASADVGDAAQMRAVLREVRERFGKVNGVIHAAGISPGRLIQAEQDVQAVNTLAPKVKGTRVLEELFKGEGLDFLILFSSLSSILGVFGQVDYCAANAFLDAFAHYNIRHNGIPTLAINWDTWRDTGMALRATQHFRASSAGSSGDEGEESAADSEQIQDLMRDAISTPEGLDAFDRILAHALMPQVVVSTREMQSVIELTERRTQSQMFDDAVRAQQEGPAHPRPSIQTDYVAPRNELEEQIAGIWGGLLGIEQVGIHDNFFELGGHSLLATQLGSRFREALFVELPLRIIFERPSVAELAQYVEQASLEVVEAPPPIPRVSRQAQRAKRAHEP